MSTHVSPSQLSTWIGCPRAWAFGRQRKRKPSKPGAVEGTEGHDISEAWLKHGTAPTGDTKMSKVVLAGLHLMPRRDWTLSETEMRWYYKGQEYLGRLDMLHDYAPGRIVSVGDHKFLADLKYMMTPERFANDPQRILYAWHAANYYAVPWVTARWIYYRKNTRHPETVVLEMTEHRSSIHKRLSALHDRVTLPLVASRGIPPERMPYNLDHCSAYGGCDHRQECHRSLGPDVMLEHLTRKKTR